MSRAMHVLICAPLASEYVADLLPRGAQLPEGYPGAPFVATLARALLDLGHRVSVLSTDSSLPVERDEPVSAGQDAFRVCFVAARRHAVRFDGRHPGRIVDGFRLERRRMAAAMHVLQPDVVHAHWSYEFGAAGIDSGLPCLVTCHDDPALVLRHSPGLYRGMRWWLSRRVLRLGRRFTTVSPQLQARLSRHVAAPLCVIPNPLPDLPSPLDDRAESPGAALRLASVINGWSRLKNAQAALEALALVRRVDARVRLTCYGSDFGPNEAAERWARAHGLADGVDFVGRLAPAALHQRLREHDVLLHPSLEESFGMALAEAIGLGVVPIAGRHSGAVPWVVGEAGLLVDVRSPHAIAQAVLALAQDPQQRRARARQGRESVLRRFGARPIAESYLGEYRACLGGTS